ncbi:hypothetical protein J3F83DRAFT_662330 [Trichoderma novae-zelandiae]
MDCLLVLICSISTAGQAVFRTVLHTKYNSFGHGTQWHSILAPVFFSFSLFLHLLTRVIMEISLTQPKGRTLQTRLRDADTHHPSFRSNAWSPFFGPGPPSPVSDVSLKSASLSLLLRTPCKQCMGRMDTCARTLRTCPIYGRCFVASAARQESLLAASTSTDMPR